MIATPIGAIRIVGDDRIVSRVRIEHGAAPTAAARAEAVRAATEQLRQWFAGERTTFDLSLAPTETPRGQALRDAMIGIAFGETISYGGLARLAASSPRAIGQACARNPFPVIVPCHRVLAANGMLGAYSAGDGPVTKRALLDHERRMTENI